MHLEQRKLVFVDLCIIYNLAELVLYREVLCNQSRVLKGEFRRRGHLRDAALIRVYFPQSGLRV